MVSSMTGFGRSLTHNKELEIEVTLRALNGRFFDLRSHLPREYSPYETEIKKILGTQLIRGTVDLYIHRRIKMQSQGLLIFDEGAALNYVKVYRELAKKISAPNDCSVRDLMARDEIVSFKPVQVNELEKALLFKAVRKALKALEEERLREGKSIHKHLSGLIKKMNHWVEQMSGLASRARQELTQKMLDRMSRQNLVSPVDPSRLQQEIAFYMDRADVAEEIQRLKEHIDQCQKLLNGKEPPGKKMDFYSQELLREVNTIGSKSPFPELTQVVVETKAVIEQMKEQVQNII